MASNSLHDLALEAQTNIQELATGLARAGADSQTTDKLTEIARVLGMIAKEVNQNPVVEHAAQHGPMAAAPPQPQPQAPGPPQGASPFQGPAQDLHAAMQASAAQRGQ